MGWGGRGTKEEHNILMADVLQERDLPRESSEPSVGCDQSMEWDQRSTKGKCNT